MKAQTKLEYKCPWCGSDFESGQELNEHAKEHYHENYEDAIPA
jgi:hypothetical protein